MAKESSLWTTLRKLLPPEGHYDRLESETSPGIPDVRYTLNGCSGFMELKAGRAPFGRRGLRQSQITWIGDEIEAGGTVWIVVKVMSDILWIPGNMYFSFNNADLWNLENWAHLVIHRGDEKPVNRIRELLSNN